MASDEDFIFDRLYIGQQLPTCRYRVDAQSVEQYWRTQGYQEIPRQWAGMVPPLLLDTLHPLKRGMKMPEGVVHAKETVEWHATLPIGAEVEGCITIADKYEKRGNRFVVFRQEMTTGSGEVCLTATKTMVWPQ